MNKEGFPGPGRYEKPNIIDVGLKKRRGKTMGISRGVTIFMKYLEVFSNCLNVAILSSLDQLIIEFPILEVV